MRIHGSPATRLPQADQLKAQPGQQQDQHGVNDRIRAGHQQRRCEAQPGARRRERTQLLRRHVLGHPPVRGAGEDQQHRKAEAEHAMQCPHRCAQAGHEDVALHRFNHGAPALVHQRVGDVELIVRHRLHAGGDQEYAGGKLDAATQMQFGHGGQGTAQVCCAEVMRCRPRAATSGDVTWLAVSRLCAYCRAADLPSSSGTP